jgi:hypothetical protein
VIRRRKDGSITRIDYRVVHPPTLEQRPLDLPPAAIVVAPEKEEALAGANER